MIRRPPRSTPFPTRRSSDLALERVGHHYAVLYRDQILPMIDVTEVLQGTHATRNGAPPPAPANHAEQGSADDSFRSEEHTSELQSQSNIVCRLLLEKKIDADDTLWQNNIYFEQAIADFMSFLNHQEMSRQEVRAVINQVERETILEHGYGYHSFAHS